MNSPQNNSTEIENELVASIRSILGLFHQDTPLWAGIETRQGTEWFVVPDDEQADGTAPGHLRYRSWHLQLPGSEPLTVWLGTEREHGEFLDGIGRILSRSLRTLQRFMRSWSAFTALQPAA